ncbi:MAG: HAD family phosphatase [Bacteriovorax sp.]|jgi:HAD superfamily hydrolase (TIGR01509 family)
MSDLKTLIKPIEAVLFDMDGTIVNTEPLHAKASVIVLKDLGIDIDLESCLDQFYGMTDTNVLKTTCPTLNDSEIEKAIAEKNIHLIKLFQKLSRAEKEQYTTPGLFDFLKFLKKENKRMAVVSASEDIIVRETLQCFEIHSYIELQMGRHQTNLTKPHPEPYLEGMRRLKAEPSKTLIFEDSPTGLESALASGAKVIRITGFAHSDKVLHTHERKNFLF